MKEIRNLNPSQSEVRAKPESRTVEGRAIVFNSLSRDMGGWKEIIAPEAIESVLKRADVLALLNHNESRGLLARYTAGEGTLILEVDSRGVKYSFEAPNTALGEEVLEGIQRKDIRTSSFAFSVAEGGEKWEKQPDESWIRTVTDFADLYDVSPVYREAYEDTSVARRSLEEARKMEIPPEVKGEVKAEEPKPEPKPKKEEPVFPNDKVVSFDELQQHYSEYESKLENL
jgi:HK97 family phage prohead protease